jgi:hypothetical protein
MERSSRGRRKDASSDLPWRAAVSRSPATLPDRVRQKIAHHSFEGVGSALDDDEIVFGQGVFGFLKIGLAVTAVDFQQFTKKGAVVIKGGQQVLRVPHCSAGIGELWVDGYGLWLVFRRVCALAFLIGTPVLFCTVR